MTHECPINGCQVQVVAGKLMCVSHWYKVPQELRTLVWRTWNRGRGRGTPEHRDAMRAAIAAVNRQVSEVEG